MRNMIMEPVRGWKGGWGVNMHRWIMIEKSRGWREEGRVNGKGCTREEGEEIKKVEMKTSEIKSASPLWRARWHEEQKSGRRTKKKLGTV